MHQNKTTPKRKYDVIIVGAGPAGCSCAHELLKENKRVLIIDKANFPRHKPCAGGITMKALRELPINIDHLIQHSSQKMIFRFEDNKKVELQNNTGSCVMVIREDFDNYYFNETIKMGAEFKKIEKIISIQSLKDKVLINFDGEEYESLYLIGADGVNSTVRKLSSKLKFKNPVFAYEGLIDKNHNNEEVTEFIFNKHGYAWIFPKKDHLNVGIGNLIDKGDGQKLKKQDLYNFVQKRFGTAELKNITGFPIGTEGLNHQTENNNIFLVGDAAGLAETLLGEGIYNAIISGAYAAKSIIRDSSDAKRYYNIFLKQLTKELKLYNKGAKILYGYPRISYFMMRLGLGKKFMDGYSEGKTLTQIMGRSKSQISNSIT
tara:strand:- start:812 stop:1936 length:1125 start_codon:yes stop_codon:yes gene_type:complete